MVRGKFESLRIAREIFPNKSTIDMILYAIERHYEIPEYYIEPKLSEIELQLFLYLKAVYKIISHKITIIEACTKDDSTKLLKKLDNVKIGLMNNFFEGIKFCRFNIGRLLFYAEEIPHFDSTYLVKYELARNRRLFFENTFIAFGKMAWDVNMSPEKVLERCRGEFINESEFKDVRNYIETFDQKNNYANIKEFARKIASAQELFQIVMEKFIPIAIKLTHHQNNR